MKKYTMTEFRGGGASCNPAPVRGFPKFTRLGLFLLFFGDLFSLNSLLARYRFENKSPKNFFAHERNNNLKNSSSLTVHSSLNNETNFSRFTSHFSLPQPPAFTMAEVLITLGIIGVICAMTLPNLIGKYQKNQTLTLLKKTYTELNLAASLAVAEYGEREYWDYGSFTAYNVQDFWNTYIIKYLKTMEVKVIRAGEINLQLDPALEYIPGAMGGSGVLKVVLSSGVNLYFWGKSAVLVDLNGRTKPNFPGRDIFIYTLVAPTDKSFQKAENFIPYGWNIWRNPVLGSAWHRNVYVNGAASYADCGCKYRDKDMASTNHNWFCAALILIDNWEMKDDYPW